VVGLLELHGHGEADGEVDEQPEDHPGGAAGPLAADPLAADPLAVVPLQILVGAVGPR